MKTTENRSALPTKPRRRRKWLSKSGRQQVFGSQAAACAALNLDPSIVRAAVRSGAPGCRAGRIYSRELMPWIERHKTELAVATDNLELRDQLIQQQIRRLRIVNDLRMEKLVPKTDVLRAQDAIQARARSEFERRLVHELPLELIGMDLAGMRGHLRKCGDELIASICAFGHEEWKA